jgi:macrolide transport system ATP-binding/permease protein
MKREAPLAANDPGARAVQPLIELGGITRSFVNGEVETRVLHGIDLPSWAHRARASRR